MLAPWVAFCFLQAYHSNSVRINHEFPSANDRYGSFPRALRTVCRRMWLPKHQQEVFAVMCGWHAIGPLTLFHNWKIDLPDGGQGQGTNIAYWFARSSARPTGFTEPVLPEVLRRVDAHLLKVGFIGTLCTIVRVGHNASAGPLRQILGMQSRCEGYFPHVYEEEVAALLAVAYPRRPKE